MLPAHVYFFDYVFQVQRVIHWVKNCSADDIQSDIDASKYRLSVPIYSPESMEDARDCIEVFTKVLEIKKIGIDNVYFGVNMLDMD
jgi:hypothetical protein